ncbi:MAG: hypothetical protein HY686_06840 [Chloroflexi bacterium]|nr:hypothetical protein [Chloroflexota bacterium]
MIRQQPAGGIRLILRRVGKYLRIAFRAPRWREYEGYLRQAMDLGYAVVPLEKWLADPHRFQGKTLVLRHDVEMYPKGALRMSAIERRLGLASTFYFRWYAFDPAVIAQIRANGSQVGLHYETLTRYAIEHLLHLPEEITAEVLDACRTTLREEIACFRSIIGECSSIAAHGDQRAHAIGYTNDQLLRSQPWRDYGLLYNPDDPAAIRLVDCWVVDGEGAPVLWWNGVSLAQAFAQGQRVILLNTHPHHWTLGAPVVARRFASYLGLLLRHPTRFERAVPEVIAWDQRQATWKAGLPGSPG